MLPGQQREENSDSTGKVKYKGGVEGSSREVGRRGILKNECSGVCVSWHLHDLQLGPGSVSSKVCGLVFEVLISFLLVRGKWLRVSTVQRRGKCWGPCEFFEKLYWVIIYILLGDNRGTGELVIKSVQATRLWIT